MESSTDSHTFTLSFRQKKKHVSARLIICKVSMRCILRGRLTWAITNVSLKHFSSSQNFRKGKGNGICAEGSPFLKSGLCIWTLPVFWGRGGMLTLAGEVCGNILSTPNWAICFILGEVRQLVRIAGRVQNLWSRFYCLGVNQKKTWSKKGATQCLFDKEVKSYLGNAQIHGPLFKKGASLRPSFHR